MIEEIRTYTRSDIPLIVKKLKKLLRDCRIITFTGPLGAGKTTLIKELLRQWGVTDMVTSPTFTYLNRYKNEAGETFYHFDLYRLKNLAEFQEAGFDEYLYEQGGHVLIEWPEIILPLLSKKACQVSLDYHEDPEKRVMRIRRGEKQRCKKTLSGKENLVS